MPDLARPARGGIAAHLDALRQAWPELALDAATGPAHHPILAIATAPGDWLAAETALHEGLDLKAQAAFVMGRAARAVATPMAALLAGAAVVPRLDPHATLLRRETYRWAHGADSGEALRHVAAFGGVPLLEEAPDALRAAFRASLTACMAPLVEGLRAASGLGAAALWRIVADMVCLGFLDLGAGAPGAVRLREEALAILDAPGSLLCNGRSGFLHVVVPDPAAPARPLAERWFLRRGGCCRWYTSPHGHVCANCVLQPPGGSEAALGQHLRRMIAAGAA